MAVQTYDVVLLLSSSFQVKFCENFTTEDNFNKVIYNCPEGIELTRRVTTNYLQLKTMYNQRKHHKMKSWNEDFINMCNELPFFTLFTNTTLK